MAVRLTTYEGGHRVPTVVRWPNVVPSGTVCRELATTMDLLPTLATVAGAEDAIPTDRVIDGENISSLLAEPENAETSRDDFAYFGSNGELRAARDDVGMKYYAEEDELYDLRSDVGERTDVSEANPVPVERLSERF